MAEANHSGSVPDPAASYERAKPEKESGMGRLDNNTDATPESAPDRQEQAVKNRQEPRQVNAEETSDGRRVRQPGATASAPQPDHSMHDEQPLGEDQMPTDITDPRQRRHPRTEGRGGTP